MMMYYVISSFRLKNFVISDDGTGTDIIVQTCIIKRKEL